MAIFDLIPGIDQVADSFKREVEFKTGVALSPARLPSTRTRLSHAFTLRAGSGRIIGAVHGANFRQARSVDDVFEVNIASRGTPVDIVPQNITTREISIARFDLYTTLMEEIFGSSEMIILTDQFRPLVLREVWDSALGLPSRRYEYTGCYFVDLGRNLDARADRVVNVDATIRWRERRRVQ